MQIDNSKMTNHCKFCRPVSEIEALGPEVIFQDSKVVSLGGRRLTPREILWYLKPLCTNKEGFWAVLEDETLLMDTLEHHGNVTMVEKDLGGSWDWTRKRYMPSTELKRVYLELERKMWKVLRRLANAD